MENLIEKIRNKKFSFARMHPAMNLDQEVVRLCDIEEIFSSQLEPLVMPKIAEAQVQKTINELKDWDLFAKLSQQLQDDIIDEVSISTLTTEELSNFSA